MFCNNSAATTSFTYSFSTVPAEILHGSDIVTPARVLEHPVTGQRVLIPGLGETPGSVYLTLFTSMFMHGGIAHIAGNMLFLWIFGDNIEDRLGHVRYVIFYLLCGVIASLAHVFTTRRIRQPGKQYAGSESGCFGCNLGSAGWLHSASSDASRDSDSLPLSHSRSGLCGDRNLVRVPVDQRTRNAGGGSQQGGVAYAAHIGGFIAGLVLIKFFDIGHGNRAAGLLTTRH